MKEAAKNYGPDLGILVAEGDCWGEFEEGIITELSKRKAPVIVVFNKGDVAAPRTEILEDLKSRRRDGADVSPVVARGDAAV